MEFSFKSEITVWDIWKLSMHNIYRSMVGISNIVFSMGIILLTYRFWNEMETILRSILVVVCILFPIMQPIMIYLRAANQVKALPKDMLLEINGTGIHVSGNNQKSHIQWNRVRKVIEEKGIVILAIEGGRGYMLTDRTLGTQKESFLDYIKSQIVDKK